MRHSSRLRLAVLCLTAFVALASSGCSGDDPLDQYRKDGAPLVTTLNPTGGLVGTIVVAKGEMFGATQGDGSVRVYCGEGGAAETAKIVSWSDTEIRFYIPPAQVTDARVIVEVTADGGKRCPYPVYLTIYSGEIQTSTDSGDN